MRKTGLVIVLLCLFVSLRGANTIDIPLRMSVVNFMPAENPTGSTPDPTDPNQFRATLTGNTLTITTQHDAVSSVVIRTDFCERRNEDYFYSLSFDSVTCLITQPGLYRIYIGYWNTDFVGGINVKSIQLFDFNGRQYPFSMLEGTLPAGLYIIRVVTDKGATTTKIISQQP